MSHDHTPRAHEAFHELARIVVSEHSVDSVMTTVAEVGKRVLPDVVDVSVTLVRGDEPETVASTGPLALLMDERQYAGGTGPCLDAARGTGIVSVPDAGAAEQWPMFAAGAREHGVGSSLSVPIALPDHVGAGINMYSARLAGFDEQDVDMAKTFAAYAAVALANVHLYEAQKRIGEQLQAAMASRGVIEQAKGIIMAQRRCSADEAFAILVRVSQHENRKLRDVAVALTRTVTEN